MAKKKPISGDKKKQAKQGARLLDDRPKAPANTDKIQLIRFDKYQALFLTLLVIVGVIIYSNTLQVPFIFDDKDAIKNNPYIRMEEITTESIIDAAVGYGKNRPVAMLSFAFNYYFGQYNVLGYHLVNIIIHIANGILLFFFLKITLALSNQQTDAARKLNQTTVISLSFFTALLWLVNPIQTQTATYIVQRMNSMGAMFYIIALLLYAKGRLAQQQTSRALGSPSQKDGKKRLSKSYYFWFAGCFVAGVLALGSKESTVLLPVLIFLYEWYFFQDLNLSWLKRSLKYLAGIVILLSLVAFIFLGSDPWEKLKTLKDFSDGHFTMGQRLMTQPRVVIYYLSLILYPHPSRLNLDYDFSLSYSLINPLTTLLCLTAILGLIILGGCLGKKERLISFCIFWFFGNLVIESSVIPLALIFEHRLYLPSMLLILIPVTLAFRYIRLNWLRAGLLGLAVVVLSVWTYQRNRVWENELSIWTDVVSKSPNKARPHKNLGKSLSGSERFDEAVDHYLEALRIKPQDPEVYINLGNAMLRQEKTDQAISYYREALRINPSYVAAHNDLGNLLLQQNKVQQAIYHYTAALRLEPGSADSHYNLAIGFDKQGKIAEAVRHYAEALRINPGLADAHYNLGVAFQKQGRLKDAITHFQQALRIQPDFTQALSNLAFVYAADKQYAKALRTFKKTAELQPDNAGHAYNIACMYALQNNIEESITWLKKAIDKGYQNWEIIKTDKDLDNIRNAEGYRELVKGR